MSRKTSWTVLVLAILAVPAWAGMVPLGIEVPAPDRGAFHFATLLAADGSGRLFACNGESLFRLDAGGSAFNAVFSDLYTAAGEVGVDPSGFAVNSGGTLAYVATGMSGRIVEVDLTTGTAREFSGARIGGYGNYGLAVHPDTGQVYVADSFSEYLSALDRDASGGAGALALLETFGNEAVFGGAIGFAPDGTLLVPVPTNNPNTTWDWGTGYPPTDDFYAKLYAIQGGPPVLVAADIALAGTNAVAGDADGNTYVLATDALHRIAPDGTHTVIAGDADLNVFYMWDVGFTGLAYDPAGDRLLFGYRATTTEPWQLYQYVVPEPATLAMLAGGAAAALLRRRTSRRRRT